MKILLVTMSNVLPSVLNEVLNPELEFSAVVVDDVEQSKNFFAKVGLPEEKIFPFYDLKDCADNFDYDVLLIISSEKNRLLFRHYLRKYEKTVHLFFDEDGIHPLGMKKRLQYYKEHSAEFEMFATGLSYVYYRLIQDKFRYKFFNFAFPSCDLYYDYQFAKFAVSNAGGMGIKYTLLGIAPYSFHYDLSLTSTNPFMPSYFMALNDFHNFWISKNRYWNLFREDFLQSTTTFASSKSDEILFDESYYPEFMKKTLGIFEYLGTRIEADVWANKNFPETRKENVKILDAYLTLCEENNIRPIMFLPPMSKGYMHYFDRQKLDEFYYLVRRALQKHSTAKFFDGWKLEPFSDESFQDGTHLNIQGAEKFSELFNEFILNLEADGN